MSQRFQDIRHRHAVYDRPNRKWVCGRTGEGKCPCLLGPGAKGHCQGGTVFDGRESGECLPRRQGDRWLCTRQEVHGGDPCPEGPLPDGSCCRKVHKCQPRPSLRHLRGRVTLVVSLMTLGLLTAFFAANRENPKEPQSAFNPGPLSSSHSFLQAECSKCHSDTELKPSRLLDFHASGFDHRAINDGRLCLNCHTEIGGHDGQHAFAAHSAPEGMLKPPAEPASQSAGLLIKAALAVKDPALNVDALSCTTCHSEHHGLKANIAEVSNRQCQMCHQRQFTSFAEGHPEFSDMNYPHSRRTRIYFDHYSHYGEYFADEFRKDPARVPAGYNPDAAHVDSQSCMACHVTGPLGQKMTVNSYEAACAKCHDEDVYSGDALAFLAFPSADVSKVNAALKVAGPPRSLGGWVSLGTSEVSYPMMALLDEDARQSWLQLRKDGLGLSGLPAGLTPEQAAHVEKVLWGIKELFVELSVNGASGKSGHDELRRRLAEAGFGNTAALIDGLPPDSFEALRTALDPGQWVGLFDGGETPEGWQAAWQELAKEVAYYQQEPPSYPAVPEEKKPDPAPTPAPATPAPAPAAGEGGNPFGGGGDAPAAGGGNPFETGGPAPAGGTTGGGGGNPFETGAPAPAPAGGGGGGGNPFETGGAAPGGGGNPFETPGGGGAANPFGGGEGGGQAQPAAAVNVPEIQPVREDTWPSAGGWFRTQESISYKATGHADPLMKAWLDELAKRVDDPISLDILRKGFDFERGVDSTRTGRCLKCHTVDEKRDTEGKLAGVEINWHAYGGAGMGRQSDRALSHYDHSSHLLFIDCRTCHVTQTAEEKRKGYADSFPGSDNWNSETGWFHKSDPHIFSSNFEQIGKATCAECHTAGKAGDSCLQCHNYHYPAAAGDTSVLDRALKREKARHGEPGESTGNDSPAPETPDEPGTAAP